MTKEMIIFITGLSCTIAATIVATVAATKPFRRRLPVVRGGGYLVYLMLQLYFCGDLLDLLR